jgi:hypothetical protein
MNTKPRTRFGSGLRRLEELESRSMLAGHGFEASFAAAGGEFFATQHIQQAAEVAQITPAFARDASFSNHFATSRDDYNGGDHDSSSTTLTASVSDSSGDTATVTYQTGSLLGTSESVITVTGDTLDEGTSVALSIDGTSVGTVAINSSGTGTLIVPTSTLSTTVAAGSTVILGTMNGTLAASTTTTSGGSGCGSSAGTSFTAAVSDSSGDTATVTFQTGKLLGTSESVINITGDTLDEGTSVALSINGTSLGTVAINSSGAGTLIVPTSTLSSTVAAGSTVVLGSLSGTFAASTTSTSGSGDSGHSGGCGDSGSSSGTNLSAPVSDSSGDTATVTYQTGKLLGTSESVIAVTGDTLDEGTSVALLINGAAVGTIAIDSTGAGTLTVPTSSLTTTVASGSTVTLGTMSGTFASSTSSVTISSSASTASSNHTAIGTLTFGGRHHGRG